MRVEWCNVRESVHSGGVESTSRAPWKIKRPQSVYEMQLPQFLSVHHLHLKVKIKHDRSGENVAQHYNISRNDQDLFAARSHRFVATHFNNGDINREFLLLQLKERCLIGMKV